MRTSQELYGHHTVDMFLASKDFWVGIVIYGGTITVSMLFLALLLAPRKVYVRLNLDSGLNEPIWFKRFTVLVALMLIDTILYFGEVSRAGIFIKKYLPPLDYYASFMFDYVSLTTIFTKL